MTRHNTLLKFSIAFALVCALTACGFHQRGATDQFNLPFRSILLGFPESSLLGVELKRNIRASGSTVVVSDPVLAEARLEVLSEAQGKEILSLNSLGRVRENLLTYNLRFRVVNAQGEEVLAPTEIALKRSITFNESQLLAKEGEEAMLYRNMQTDLVQQIMRRLAAIKPK